MTHQNPEMNLIVQRLGNLERSNRRLKYLVSAVTVAFCLLVGWPRQKVDAAVGQSSQVIEAQGLRIKDVSGRVRAEIRTNEDTAGLLLYAPNGEQQAAIMAGPVAGVNLSGPNGKRVGLVLTNDGISLGFYDPNKVVRAFLAVTNDGPSLSLYDPSGNARTSLSLAKDGPSLILFDGSGSRRASLGLTRLGSGLVFLGPTGEPRASFGFTQNAPLLALLDSKGQVISQLP